MDSHSWRLSKNHIFPLVMLPLFYACNQTPLKSLFRKEEENSDTTATVAKADSTVKKKKTTAWQPLKEDTSKTYIYLTFDDGPQPGTSNCYNICKNLGVKASFFMIGKHIELSKMRYVADSIREDYPNMLLANHSYSHAAFNHYNYFYSHPDSALADFFRSQDSLKPMLKIARLPGNNAWVLDKEIRANKLTSLVSKGLDSAGYDVVGWDVEWHFKKGSQPVQSANQMIANIEKAAGNAKAQHTPHHLVILAHDRMFRQANNADSLTKVVNTLKNNPLYVFETVDHYPKLKLN